MQRLAELLRHAVEKGVLSLDDLYGTEDDVIAKITADDRLRAEWAAYRSLHQMLLPSEAAADAAWRVIPAKKRCIDPLVAGKGDSRRLTPILPRSFPLSSSSRWTNRCAQYDSKTGRASRLCLSLSKKFCEDFF